MAASITNIHDLQPIFGKRLFQCQLLFHASLRAHGHENL
jgi:hypothetical protein